MDDFKGIKEAVYGAKKIIILLCDNPSQDAAGASLALFSSLKNIDKIVNLPGIENLPVPASLLPREDGQKTFLISLKKNVSEVYYEKNDGEVKLYIKTKNGGIGLEEISFGAVPDGGARENREKDERPSSNDLLAVAIGIKNFQDIEEKNPDQNFSDIKIINIDNNRSNQKYADFNLIREDLSLSQICFLFIKALGPGFAGKNAADALLYGFSKDKEAALRKDPISFLAWLAKNGADLSIWTGGQGPGQKLLAETIKKMEDCHISGLHCSLLDKKDFESAEAKPSHISLAVSEIKKRLAVSSLLIMFETEKNGIIGVFYSDEESLIEKACLFFKGKRKNNGMIFQSGQKTLTEAKKEFLDAIG